LIRPKENSSYRKNVKGDVIHKEEKMSSSIIIGEENTDGREKWGRGGQWGLHKN
jgi:hypothetical protein